LGKALSTLSKNRWADNEKINHIVEEIQNIDKALKKKTKRKAKKKV
jgi:hypothetical protein